MIYSDNCHLSTSDLDVRRCMCCCQLSPSGTTEKSGPECTECRSALPQLLPGELAIFWTRSSLFRDAGAAAAISTTTTTHSLLYHHNTADMGRIKKKGMHVALSRDHTHPNNHSQAPPAMPKTTSPAPRPSANSNFPSQTSDDYVSSRVSTRVSRATGSA